MERIKVNASRSYEVKIGRGLLGEIGSAVTAVHAPCKICIVSDVSVYRIYGAAVRKNLEGAGFSVSSYLFLPGENDKSLKTVGEILDYLCEEEFTRSDLILALGGGVAGDVAGFAASVFLRGIEFIQVPTTLLAMLDSSVGGKTGVNLTAGKNLAGAFWQPSLVICDTAALDSLPEHELLDGIAEGLKYGVIRDAELFDRIEALGYGKEEILSSANSEALEGIIADCVRITAAVVEEDEKDKGVRQILNYGHTFGHAIEKLSSYETSHGHAVATGMCMAADAAVVAGLLEDASLLERLKGSLAKYGFETESRYGAEEIAAAAQSDKKKKGAELTLVLPKRMGEVLLYKISADKLADFLE